MTRRPLWPGSEGSQPLVTPIQPSVVYSTESLAAIDALYTGEASGYTYAREGHPNADALAAMIDRFEGVEGGLVTGSGMAAVTAAMIGVLKNGDHALGADQLYGKSLRFMSEVLPRWSIATSLADPTTSEAFIAGIRPETRLVLVETISNPTMRVADIAEIAAACRARGILLAIDNTFATPLGFQAADHADIVIHSVTKLLGGHSDATLGWVWARDRELNAKIALAAATLGLTASPFDCWLAERGLLTFPLRYERASANAAGLADTLAGLPGISRVIYPMRPDHPDHNRAVALLQGKGGNMLAFELEGARPEAEAFIRALKAIPYAPTLGDVSTTISHPATSSHRGLSPSEREDLGISDAFFRLSVGCEPVGEIESALTEALEGPR